MPAGAKQGHHDVVARPDPLDAGADLLDHPGRLVAGNGRQLAAPGAGEEQRSLWQIAQAAILTLTSPGRGPASSTCSIARGFRTRDRPPLSS